MRTPLKTAAGTRNTTRNVKTMDTLARVPVTVYAPTLAT